MKRIALSLTLAAAAALGTVAAVSAADPSATPAPAAIPTPGGPAGGILAGILGMTQDEIRAERVAGRSLAQIAASRGVAPQRLVDALVEQWTERIDARAAAGALAADDAAALKADLGDRSSAMVNQTAPGGMHGVAAGGGPGAMGGAGMRGGMGHRGAMDGTGGPGMGHHGGWSGTGTCPMTTTPAPQS